MSVHAGTDRATTPQLPKSPILNSICPTQAPATKESLTPLD